MVGEIWLGSAFDETNLNTLLKYVSGSDSISTNDLSVLLSALNRTTNLSSGLIGITAYQMRASTGGGKEEDKDIVVTFGGLNWTPTYLSKDKSGDLILTLWLSDSAQLEGKTYDPTRDPFDANGKATWVAEGRPKGDKFQYPDNMYGTSYMNAVVLNNGGRYKSDCTKDEVIEVQASDSHAFAAFTTGEIAQYLDTPSQVTWQEYGQYERMIEGYALSNENWSKNILNGRVVEDDPTRTTYKFFDVASNYASISGSDQWAKSKLWLPSLSETGISDSERGIWRTSTAQRSNTTDSWLRSGFLNSSVPYTYYLKSSGSDRGYYDGDYSNAVRPALHLNLNKATGWEPQPLATTVNEFDENNASDPKFADIYKITRDNGIDFHIKTAAGFLKLSEASSFGQAFDPSWTFYLDNDITINADNTYVPVGEKAHPFLGTFNGLGVDNKIHKIDFTLRIELIKNMALFGTVGNCTIKNLIVNNSISSLNDYKVSGLVGDSLADTTCNISHVTLQGSLVGQSYVYGVGIFTGNVNLYDVSLLYSSLRALDGAYVFGLFGSSCIADSCRAIVSVDDYNYHSAPIALFNGQNLNINNVYANLTLTLYAKLEAFSGVQNLTCAESQLDLKFLSSPSTTPKIISEGSAGSINLYDALFNCRYLTNLFGDGNYPSNGKYYYSGVYINGPKTSTTILDPNFTSSKWRIDTSDESATPVLAQFLPTGKDRNPNMESLNMSAWAKEKMAS